MASKKKERRYFWVERKPNGRVHYIHNYQPTYTNVDVEGKKYTIKRELWEKVEK